MKTKKLLALLLAVAMLVVPFAVVSNAAGTYTIVAPSEKTAYLDTEFFAPYGLVINDGTNDVAYSPNNADFSFVPALNELLSVDDAEVQVFYKNEYVGTVAITVEHKLGELVSIDSKHGRYCLGCGEVHELEDHVITNWVPNDDGSLFFCQTETGKCDICGGSMSRDIPGTEKILAILPQDGTMTDFEAEIMGYFYSIAVTLIQMLASIR